MRMRSKAILGQGDGSYRGIDGWVWTSLKKGELICQADRRVDVDKEEVIESGSNSGYYASIDALEDSKDQHGKASIKKYSEAVQLCPYQQSNGQYLYAPNIIVYQVQKDFQCETSEVEQNHHLGDGGAQQFLTDNKALVQQGYLKPIKIISFNDDERSKHDIAVLKECEEKNLSPYKTSLALRQEHERGLQAMERGNDQEQARAKRGRDQIKARERYKYELYLENRGDKNSDRQAWFQQELDDASEQSGDDSTIGQDSEKDKGKQRPSQSKDIIMD